jgi:hypothetical protein
LTLFVERADIDPDGSEKVAAGKIDHQTLPGRSPACDQGLVGILYNV